MREDQFLKQIIKHIGCFDETGMRLPGSTDVDAVTYSPLARYLVRYKHLKEWYQKTHKLECDIIVGVRGIPKYTVRDELLEEENPTGEQDTAIPDIPGKIMVFQPTVVIQGKIVPSLGPKDTFKLLGMTTTVRNTHEEQASTALKALVDAAIIIDRTGLTPARKLHLLKICALPRMEYWMATTTFSNSALSTADKLCRMYREDGSENEYPTQLYTPHDSQLEASG